MNEEALMSNTVFFSWQSDRLEREGHNLIEQALKTAVARIAKDAAVEDVVRDGLMMDKDTKGVPGSPPIFDTILAKIGVAAVFVPDLTFIGTGAAGRSTPNPNVLIEYGWSLKSLGYSRIIPVMNEAHGKPTKESMPFDMAHLRFPITYDLPDGASDAVRRAVREQLAKELEAALRAVFESEAFKSALPKAPEPPPFRRKEPLNGRARFRSQGKPLGAANDPLMGLVERKPENIYLSDGPAMWLRLMPAYSPDRMWLISKLAEQAGSLAVLPLTSFGAGSIGLVKAADGCGYYPVTGDQMTPAVSFIFESGEVWAIKVFGGLATSIPFEERKFIRSVEHCADFLDRLGAPGPYRWVAGIADVEGWPLFSDSFNGRLGRCMAEVIEVEGAYRKGERAEESLRPFFEKVYDQCGVPSILLSQGAR
jgi:hypothetical protein